MSPEKNRLGDEVGRLAALDRYRLRRPTDGADQFQSLTDLVADVFGVGICSISIINDDVQYFAAVTGVEKDLTARSDAICSRTIERDRPLVIQNLLNDSRFAQAEFVTDDRHFRSYAGVPLQTPDGYNIGALCLIDRDVRDFSQRDLDLLERFASVVVEQMELRTLAHQDFLTGTLSRRAFTQRATQLVDSGRSAALIAIDIDHFKRINDAHGYACGDEVLKAIARHLASTMREGDEVGRIGGEEFAVVLRDANEQVAAALAERLRREIEAMDLPHREPVTASFGVAEAMPGQDFARWLHRADTALYEAKRTGRNKVVLADAPSASG